MPRILIIDDDDQLRGLVRQMLEISEYEVSEASDGDEGIKAYQKNPYDLVITDLIMPKKEGLETIMELRRDYPEAKIIAMSGGGYGGPNNYLGMAEKFGANRTLLKPFGRTELLDAVKETLIESACKESSGRRGLRSYNKLVCDKPLL